MSEIIDRDSPLRALLLFTCWLIHRLSSPGADLLTGYDIRKGSQRGTVSHSSTCLSLTHIHHQPAMFLPAYSKTLRDCGLLEMFNKCFIQN